MDKLLGPLKGLVKLQGVVIDNAVFRLHYKLTAPILVAFSLLVTSKQHIGDPIQCISRDDIPNKVLDTFCWIHATFSLEGAWNKKVGTEVAYPGVASYKEGDSRVFHAYYQWVCFVLFLQALLFCVPRYFWKCMESGRIKAMIMDLHQPVMDETKKREKLKLLVNYVVATMNNNENYSLHYLISETLNVINVIGQMHLIDTFLGGAFSTYGTQVLKFSDWDWTLRYDPMIRVFPRLTKCTFHRYGSSGDIQKHDAMCILPINILNEKIYIFLWFWFIILSVLSCLALVYRATIFLSHEMRVKALKSRASLVQDLHAEIVVRKAKVGDWFVVLMLAKNLHSVHFRDFMVALARRMEGKDHNDAHEGFSENSL